VNEYECGMDHEIQISQKTEEKSLKKTSPLINILSHILDILAKYSSSLSNLVFLFLVVSNYLSTIILCLYKQHSNTLE